MMAPKIFEIYYSLLNFRLYLYLPRSLEDPLRLRKNFVEYGEANYIPVQTYVA